MKNTISLKNSQQFGRVYKCGKSRADKFCVMYVLDNDTDSNRLGISVSKKVGNSVVRHRMCRLIREAYRLHENVFNSGLDIVVVARRGSAKCSYFDIEDSLMHLARIHHILAKKK